MDPDLKRLLQVTQENNEMLHKLVADLRMRRVWGFIRWAILIGSAVGLYYWLQPYIETLIVVYGAGIDQLENLKQLFIANSPR